VLEHSEKAWFRNQDVLASRMVLLGPLRIIETKTIANRELTWSYQTVACCYHISSSPSEAALCIKPIGKVASCTLTQQEYNFFLFLMDSSRFKRTRLLPKKRLKQPLLELLAKNKIYHLLARGTQ
jgi:hypothetical protein